MGSSKIFRPITSESYISLIDDLEKEVREIKYPTPLSQIKRFSNYVKTTKYTILTFIPLNLWQQVNILF